MDWNQFIQKTSQLALKPSLQIEDVEDYLAFCKEKIAVFSTMQRFFLQMGLLQTQFGRDLFLQSIFQTLKEHIPFQDAPVEAVQAFDGLIEKLFSKSVARKLEIPIPLRKEVPQDLFEEIEALRTKSKQFQDLQRELSTLYEEHREWRITQGTQETLKNISSKVFHIQEMLTQRQKSIQELERNYKALSSQAMKLNIDEEMQASSWKEHVDVVNLLKTGPFTTPKQFADEKAFKDWYEQEKKKLAQKKQLVEHLENGLKAKTDLQSLLDALKTCRQAIFEIYGKQYAAEVEEGLRSGKKTYSQDLVKEIEEQKKLAISLNRELQEKYQDLQRRCIPFYEEVCRIDFIMFVDLPKELEEIVHEDPPNDVLIPGPLTDVKNEVEKKLQQFFERQFHRGKELIEKGRERKKLLDVVKTFQTHYEQSLVMCSLYPDMQKKRTEILKDIQQLTLDKNMFQKLSSTETDEYMKKYADQYQTMLKNSVKTIQEIQEECHKLEDAKIVATHTIKRRLFEIFSILTPYADLQNRLEKMHAFACNQIERFDDLFYKGKIALSDYRLGCFELAYDHDIMQLRSDLSFRATRLRELREETHRLLNTVLQMRRLFDIISFSKEDDIYKEILLVQDELFQYLFLLENPFQVFAKCVEFESVNTMFRKLWIELESLQPKVQTVAAVADLHFKKQTPVLQKKFMHLLDDLEEVLKVENKRPQLVNGFQVRMKDVQTEPWIALKNEFLLVEKTYPFVQPFSFFFAIEDANVRKKLLLQSKEIFEKQKKQSLLPKHYST